jgi:hypothetical protein
MNGDESNLITLEVEGPTSEDGHVRADEFVDKLEHLLTTLNGIDRMVGDTAQPTLYYRIVSITHSSPVTVTLEPVVRPRVAKPSPDHIKARHHRFFRELDAIHKNEPVSPEVDEQLLENLRDLALGVGESFKRAAISNFEVRVELDEVFETNVQKMLGEEYTSYGGVDGMLEAVNIHGTTRRFWIYPRIGAQKVRCDFLPGTKDLVREAVGHYVRVEGYKYFRSQNPYPTRILVREFEVLDKEEPVPLARLRGTAPDATGNVSAVDFVRAIRDEWD